MTTYHSTYPNSSSSTGTKDEDPSSIVANMTIDELVESCCNEVAPASSSSQLNGSSSVSPSHLVRFVHSQSSLISQIDETNHQQSPSTPTLSSHETPTKQPPLINVTRLPSPFSTIKPKAIFEANNSMYNTTNLTNITANNISVNNYNVNIHTTNVQQPTQTVLNNNHSHEHLPSKCASLDEKQTTDIVSQILKNIKEVDNTNEQPTTTTTNYNIHIDSFNFSSSNEQQAAILTKKTRIKKEAKALTRIIVKDELTQQPMSPNFLRTKKTTKTLSNHSQASLECIPVPYGWQRRILATDLVVYLSPTNVTLDSLDAVRRYLESATSCKCGLQCPLVVDKVFNFDSTVKSKSWEVTQVLEGTHCREKSNILEMATLTNCIDSFCEPEQKPVKRRKRISNESSNGNVFVCASNVAGNSNNDSVVFVNNTSQSSETGQSMAWTPVQQGNLTPSSKRPRGRPRKTTATSPILAQLAVKPANDSHPTQPVPSSILSPPASVSSTSQTNLVHPTSTSPSILHHPTNNIRYMNENILTPPILSTSTTDTNVIARVPSLFDQVKSTTNESTFAVLSGVQNVLLSPNSNNKRLRTDSASSGASVTNAVTGKQVTLNVNALKPDFVRSPAAVTTTTTQKSCLSTSNQMDVISLMGANNQTSMMLSKPSTNSQTSSTNEEYSSNKSTNEQATECSQPLMIDFNDPSTTNFLLSALASGASSDSNAIVNHLFQKAQTQQQRTVTTSPSPPLVPSINSTVSIKSKLPIIPSNSKTCTETTNLLPTTRPSVVLHVPSNNDHNYHEEKKQHQQIFFINNKPYIIQQKISNDQSSQQRLVLTPSIPLADELHPSNRNLVTVSNNSSHTSVRSTLDDGGSCLRLNGRVEPKTLRTLLKGLNSTSFSGVDNLIDTINRFEHTTSSLEQNDNLLIKSKPTRRRTTKRMKQEEGQQQRQQQIQISMSVPPQPIIVEQQQQQWQTDFNSFDFSTAWGSDTNLNSLLLNDDFDTAASFDDVNFGELEPYMNGNNNDLGLPSLFAKPLPPDSLANVDHLLS